MHLNYLFYNFSMKTYTTLNLKACKHIKFQVKLYNENVLMTALLKKSMESAKASGKSCQYYI